MLQNQVWITIPKDHHGQKQVIEEDFDYEHSGFEPLF